ncbi:MAG TPA: ClpX C4-type zinc finger protein [Vicinamibacterales bacterium]|nr:ClpX C4-type zinc finger protein [Vicinamibacterales bacterium]
MWFRTLRCSFCRRSDHEVEKLVAGARGYICDRCAREVMRIIESTPPREADARSRPVELASSEWNRAWHFAKATET